MAILEEKPLVFGDGAELYVFEAEDEDGQQITGQYDAMYDLDLRNKPGDFGYTKPIAEPVKATASQSTR